MAESIAQPRDKGVLSVYRSPRDLMIANFLGGLSWGFGSVLGATVLVGVLLLLLKVLGGVPLIGSYVNDISRAISHTTHP